jgi:CheY-like chemotaxis protein
MPSSTTRPAATCACCGARRARRCASPEDDGCGIAEEDLPRLFQPFERLATPDPGIEGLGLGLSNVKRLLEAMGGSVEVHSRLGEGSRFTVSLQRMAPPVPARPGRRRCPRAAAAGPHPLCGRRRNQCPAAAGHAGRRAGPGGDGLPRRRPGAGLQACPDLWIIDGQLPDMDGVDLLKQLQRRPAPHRGR